ncbi:MAG: hypothetical protein ACLP01_12165 [Solirubrobacteraceae bacterium]
MSRGIGQFRVSDDRESVGIILWAAPNDLTARLALQRIYSPIAVTT